MHSPSDHSRFVQGAAIQVGGRIVRDGIKIFLSDAFDQIELIVEETTELEHNDLVVVSGLAFGRSLDVQSIDLQSNETRPRASSSSSEDLRIFRDFGLANRLRERASMLSEIRGYFAREHFLEVQTPALVPSPGLDVHLDAFEVQTNVRGKERDAAYLITSPEYQMKRMLSGGLPRIFQITPCFRKDEAGERHNREFTMLEWYRAFASLAEIMEDTLKIVRLVLHGRPVRVAEQEIDLEKTPLSLSVTEAFSRYAQVNEETMLEWASNDETRFYEVLSLQIEPQLACEGGLVILHRYPKQMASLAKLCEDDVRYAQRFELYAGGIELCNGFGELTDPVEQRARLVNDQKTRLQLGLPVYPIDEKFLQALEMGMPPSAGNALGLDRLLMLRCGASSIDQVLSFSETRLNSQTR